MLEQITHWWPSLARTLFRKLPETSRLNLLPSQERTSGPLAARKYLPIRTLRSDCDEAKYREVVLRGVEYPLEYEGGLVAGDRC